MGAAELPDPVGDLLSGAAARRSGTALTASWMRPPARETPKASIDAKFTTAPPGPVRESAALSSR